MNNTESKIIEYLRRCNGVPQGAVAIILGLYNFPFLEEIEDVIRAIRYLVANGILMEYADTKNMQYILY